MGQRKAEDSVVALGRGLFVFAPLHVMDVLVTNVSLLEGKVTLWTRSMVLT